MTETVTLTREEYERMSRRLAEYDALLEEMEDAQDLAIAAERRGEATIPFDMVERMLDGESPVRVWRDHRDLTQAALAGAAGISPAMLNEIEEGTCMPSVATARALAQALATGLDDLFPEPPGTG